MSHLWHTTDPWVPLRATSARMEQRLRFPGFHRRETALPKTTWAVPLQAPAPHNTAAPGPPGSPISARASGPTQYQSWLSSSAVKNLKEVRQAASPPFYLDLLFERA